MSLASILYLHPPLDWLGGEFPKAHRCTPCKASVQHRSWIASILEYFPRASYGIQLVRANWFLKGPEFTKPGNVSACPVASRFLIIKRKAYSCKIHNPEIGSVCDGALGSPIWVWAVMFPSNDQDPTYSSWSLGGSQQSGHFHPTSKAQITSTWVTHAKGKPLGVSLRLQQLRWWGDAHTHYPQGCLRPGVPQPTALIAPLVLSALHFVSLEFWFHSQNF